MGERDPYLGGATRLKKCLHPWGARIPFCPVSHSEIYKEEVIDLLKGDENGKGVGPSHVPIQIRETTNSGILLACVTEVEVTSQEEMMSLMLRVFVRRSTGITNMNSQTSLSPAILLFTWNKNELLAWKVED
ncbi:kinesin-like protein KIN-4C [Tanacetum coccineum]